MKVTIDFSQEISEVIQEHLDTGISVQNYVRASVIYFNKMLRVERKGNACGFGDKDRFNKYNSILSPTETFNEI